MVLRLREALMESCPKALHCILLLSCRHVLDESISPFICMQFNNMRKSNKTLQYTSSQLKLLPIHAFDPWDDGQVPKRILSAYIRLHVHKQENPFPHLPKRIPSNLESLTKVSGLINEL